MTDMEKLKSLLAEFGISFKEKPTIGYGNQCVMIEQGTEKVIGYTGFVTEFLFDNNGKFIQVGIWE